MKAGFEKLGEEKITCPLVQGLGHLRQRQISLLIRPEQLRAFSAIDQIY